MNDEKKSKLYARRLVSICSSFHSYHYLLNLIEQLQILDE